GPRGGRPTFNGPSRLPFEVLQGPREQGGILPGEQVLDPSGWEPERRETRSDLLTKTFALLPFGQIKLRRQIGQTLILDSVEVLVIAFDDLLLVGGEVAHRCLPRVGLVCQSAAGFWRPRLTSERRALSSARRSFEARVGRVG